MHPACSRRNLVGTSGQRLCLVTKGSGASAISDELFALRIGSRKAFEIAATGSSPIAIYVEPLTPLAIVIDKTTSKLNKIDLATSKSFWQTAVGLGPVALAVNVSAS